MFNLEVVNSKEVQIYKKTEEHQTFVSKSRI